MKKGGIFITEFDLERLQKLIEEKRAIGGDSAYLNDLEEELSRARIVGSKDIPGDVITMNSTACLRDLATGEELTLSLVFPQDADIEQGRISILAPIGTGMIGYRTGDVIEWQVPAGLRRIEIKEIYTVSPNSRYTVLVNAEAGPDLAISAEIASDEPIICERPMYFNYNGVWTGRHGHGGIRTLNACIKG